MTGRNPSGVWKGPPAEYRILENAELARSRVPTTILRLVPGQVCIEVDEPLPCGTHLAIDFRAPELGQPVLLLARVADCKRSLFGGRHEVRATPWWTGPRDTDAPTRLIEHINASLRDAAPARPISELFDDIVDSLPKTLLGDLPPDGAEQHDHYIYGTPKRKA